MKKKILIFIAAGAVIVLLAIVVLVAVVDVDSFRGVIEGRAEEELGRDVHLGRLGLSIVPSFGLTVDDVTVAAGPGEADLLRVRSVRIGARLLPLLSRRLEVTSVVIVEPEINLARDADGSWNFDLGRESGTGHPPAPAAEPGAAPELIVDTLRIISGRVSVRDASRSADQPTEVALTDLELELSSLPDGGGYRMAVDHGRLKATDPALAAGSLDVELGAVDVAVREGGKRVELTRLELIAGGTAVALAGSIAERADGWQVDADLEPAGIDPDDLSSLLAGVAGDLGISLTGGTPVRIEAGIHGLLAEGRLPEIDARAALENVNLDAAALTRPVTGIHAAVALHGTEVKVSDLHMAVGDNDVSGSLRLLLRDRPSLDFDLTSERANIGELLGLLAPTADADADEGPVSPDSFLVQSTADGRLEVADGSWADLRFRDLRARLRMSAGVATLEPVSMELYGGTFNGRLESDLTRDPQDFEFAGTVENVDVDPFIVDQMGSDDILFGRFTGRVEGSGSGADPQAVIRTLDATGQARVEDGRVGRLDLLRSIGQVAGVLGQRTLANLASDSAAGATRFDQLAGDFRIGDGQLSIDSVSLRSTAFDLTGAAAVSLTSSVIDGTFEIRFSPQVSAWMREESSRAAELFWDSGSDRVVLPLALSGTLSGAGVSVDWSAAAKGVARRAIEDRLTDLLGDVLGADDTDREKEKTKSVVAEAGPQAAPVPEPSRRATAPSGRFALEVVKTEWGGSFFAQDFKIQCRITGTGAERVEMTAVDTGGRTVESSTVDLAGRAADASGVPFEARVDGKRLLLAGFPVTVTLTAIAADGETATIDLEIKQAGR